MTPELRLDRAERLLMLVIRAGDRERKAWRRRTHEQEQKINMVINAHIDACDRMDKLQARTDAQIENLFVAQARTDEQIDRAFASIQLLSVAHEELAAAHAATERSLKTYLDSLNKGQNGNSSS